MSLNLSSNLDISAIYVLAAAHGHGGSPWLESGALVFTPPSNPFYTPYVVTPPTTPLETRTVPTCARYYNLFFH